MRHLLVVEEKRRHKVRFLPKQVVRRLPLTADKVYSFFPVYGLLRDRTLTEEQRRQAYFKMYGPDGWKGESASWK